MNEDSSHLIDIDANPTYQASLRLKSGPIVRVTVLDGEIRAGISADHGRAADGWMTADEAGEVAGMLRAAERQCP